MIPQATDKLDEWRQARRRSGRMLVALDFDGTLAPIVERPEDAQLLPAAERALTRLARRGDTDIAIVSGRALEDVRRRIGLPGLYYAGNHGLEIEGPDLSREHPAARDARPRIAACAEALRRALAERSGVEIEDKGLTLSVHYRRSPDPETAEAVRHAVGARCGAVPELSITEGKALVEIRPDVDWDKGRATRFLLDTLEASHEAMVPAIFIGDDQTDEDAFRALRDQGDGVIVARERPEHTAARAVVASPTDVATLLDALADAE